MKMKGLGQLSVQHREDETEDCVGSQEKNEFKSQWMAVEE
jgi:hypothetical protein